MPCLLLRPPHLLVEILHHGANLFVERPNLLLVARQALAHLAVGGADAGGRNPNPC